MQKKTLPIVIPEGVLLFFLFFTPLIAHPAFCATQAVEFLCETGINFYRVGRYDDALTEFNKALLMDPSNQTAKKYINNIFKEEMPAAPAEETLYPIQEKTLNKQEAMDVTADIVKLLNERYK